MKSRTIKTGVFYLLALGVISAPGVCLGADQTILLQGVVAANCSIVVTADPAASALPLTVAGAQRIKIGTILQNCNKKTGFTLKVESAGCAALPVGAKVIDPVSGESVPYSVEFNNPTTGGSLAIVTGLLATTCMAAVGREVTAAKVVTESSNLYVNYTGVPLLAAGTYQDTITITLNLK
jgi:hypothetical protein